MISIRRHTFETNSSSCHVVTIVSKDWLNEVKSQPWNYVFHFPDTGDYQTSDRYKILKIEDALKLYNSIAREVNKKREERNKNLEYPNELFKIYVEDEDGEDEFEEDIHRHMVPCSPEFGKFLTYTELMASAIIDKDMKFDIGWWNNQD